MKAYLQTILSLVIAAVLTCIPSAVLSGQRTRVLQEVVDASQRLQRLNGMPVVTSEKSHSVLISPRDIILGNDEIIYFLMVISNPTDVTMMFSIDDVKIVSNKMELHLLTLNEVLAKERAFYSKEGYQITSDQEKALAPFVEEKIEQLRRKVLKSETIKPGEKITGYLAVEVPFGTEQFSVLVATSGEVHQFDFNIGEF